MICTLSFAKLGASRDSYLALNAVKIISTCMTRSSSRLACNHALSLHLCNLFSVWHITCKKARIWTFFWLDRRQKGWFAPFRSAKMSPSVSCCWFQSAFLLPYNWAVNRINTQVSYEISAGSVFVNLEKVYEEISSIEIFSISSYT